MDSKTKAWIVAGIGIVFSVSLIVWQVKASHAAAISLGPDDMTQIATDQAPQMRQRLATDDKARKDFAKNVRELLAVAEECRAHGIPECFFARAHKQLEPAQMDSALDARKPLWIDTRNPFCLELFERIARDVEWVVITEALPDIDHSWVLVRGERHVSEFQVEMGVSTADRI